MARRQWKLGSVEGHTDTDQSDNLNTNSFKFLKKGVKPHSTKILTRLHKNMLLGQNLLHLRN